MRANAVNSLNGREQRMRLVAVDIGQSGSRVRTSDGIEFLDGPAFDAAHGVLASVERTIKASGITQADIIALSLTGLRGDVADPRAFGERCAAMTGAHAVAVADDGYAALTGAIGADDGVVLAVGSGVAVVDRHGSQAAHRDGDGPILGDDGGGFWLGRAGLRAAVRASEGRGPETLLLTLAEELHGPVRGLIRSGADAETMRKCIAFARSTLQAAASGDAIALHIRAVAAARLADTATAAWRAVGSTDATFVASYTGGIMADTGLRDAVAAELLARLPHARWQAARGDNLDGALAIAGGDRSDVLPLLKWWQR